MYLWTKSCNWSAWLLCQTSYRQPTHRLYDLCLRSLNCVHGNELLLFWAKAFLYSNYLCCAPEIAAVGTIFNIFTYDTVSGRDSNLSPSRQRADALHVTSQSRVMLFSYLGSHLTIWLEGSKQDEVISDTVRLSWLALLADNTGA